MDVARRCPGPVGPFPASGRKQNEADNGGREAGRGGRSQLDDSLILLADVDDSLILLADVDDSLILLADVIVAE